jgi:leucyl-tRNA synthetase
MNFKDWETKWQERWEKAKLFKVSSPPNTQKKCYVLEMFAYPSGDIHMGHFRNYVLGDVLARYKMLCGYEVMHPFGWDAFGLPAEEAAIKRGIHPRDWTLNNIEVSRTTLKRIGISYDWDREVITCLPEYYRWNQWLFLKMFEKGLAYQALSLVNWCTGCKTVLANEQVHEGACWRCHSQVVKKELLQWFFKITAYAERLLNDIEKLEGWPEHVKAMQKNWIGKSEGARVVFKLDPEGIELPVYTTRPDTLFGVTFITLAPEHPLSAQIIKGVPHEEKIRQFIEKSLLEPEMVRTALGEKNGIATGRFAIHPLTGEKIPIWIGDYVVASYGTGIVMGVPAHDQRDFLFAKKYHLPIKVVIEPHNRRLFAEEMKEAFEEDGTMVNSGEFTGFPSFEGRKAVTQKLQEKNLGHFEVRYKLRDWLISRQRYWGTPIPIVHCPSCKLVPVRFDELPVKLPEGKIDFIPKGRSPLEDVKEFFDTTCPQCGGKAHRDPDTMDTFVDSSWYFLRYLDPKNEKLPFDPQKANRWLPIDYYIGGLEHATGHLLYFRFFTKILYDMGYLSVDEPSLRLFNQGMVMDKHGEVMSKSKGNVVSPVDLMNEVGADVARVAMLFSAPPEKDLLWSEEGVSGASRFLTRVWRHGEKAASSQDASLARSEKVWKKLHQTIKKVTDDLERFSFHTGIAALMELLNVLDEEPLQGEFYREVMGVYAQLLAPYAPHFSEELWEKLGKSFSIFQSSWPIADPKALEEKEIEIVIQVNGRIRDRLVVSIQATESEIKSKALDLPKIKSFLDGKQIKNIIVVPGKLVNIVCGS